LLDILSIFKNKNLSSYGRGEIKRGDGKIKRKPPPPISSPSRGGGGNFFVSSPFPLGRGEIKRGDGKIKRYLPLQRRGRKLNSAFSL